MSKHMIPPWMIPTKPQQPAQIPLEPPSIYDRRPAEDSDREKDPFSIDIGGNDGDEDSGPTYRC